MLVLHENPPTDFSVILPTDNFSSFVTESPFSNWGVNTTLSSAFLSTSEASLVSLGNITSTWGPKRDPLYIVVPITVLYVVILLTGLIGNVSTCIVIARNKHMHTATNYYLFSLAVSDLLLLVSGLPQEMYYNWSRYPYVFGEAFCVLQGFAAETSANATVLTITAFTVERYVAICHPFQSHTLSKLSRAVRLILLIWLLAMGLAVPQAIQFGVVYEELPDGRVLDDEHTVCAVKRVVIPHSFEVSSLVFFVAPMTLISVLYALIGLQLRRSSLRRGGGSVRLKTGVGGNDVCYAQQYSHHQNQTEDGRKNFSKNAQIKATKHVVKMLVAVVVAFFICWAPFHAQRLLAVYASGNTSPSMVIVYHALTYTSGVLYYLSTTVNPVLYHIMSHKFREAFKDTLARYLGRRRARGGRWQCYTVLSGRSSRHSNTSNPPSIASNCGTANGSLRRYLEADMARLHASRRPIVVSFRRHHTQIDSTTPSIADTEVSGGSTSTGPEVYVSLEELTKNNSRYNSRKISKLKKTRNKFNETYLSVIFRHSKSSSKEAKDKFAKDSSDKAELNPRPTSLTDSSYLCSMSSELQPDDAYSTPWCSEKENGFISSDVDIYIPEESIEPIINLDVLPLDNTQMSDEAYKRYPKVEDIEIFQEQQLKIQSSFKKRHRASKHNRRRNKIHKPPNASSSSIEYYFRESRDKTSNESDVKHVVRSPPNGLSFCNVPRSSTLPSFQTNFKESDVQLNDRRVQAMDLSIQSLRNPIGCQGNCDGSLSEKALREKRKTRLVSQHSNDISEGKNSKTSEDSDSVDSNNVSRSEPCMKENYEGLLERRYLFEINEIPRDREDAISPIKFQSKCGPVNENKCQNNFSCGNCSKSSNLSVIQQDQDIRGSTSNISKTDKSSNLSVIQVQDIRGSTSNISKTDRELEITPEISDLSGMEEYTRLYLHDIDESEIQITNGNCTMEEKQCLLNLPHQVSSKIMYEHSTPLSCGNSRPKSCTDLTLLNHVATPQNCDMFSVHSSSPRLAPCNVVL